MTATRTTVNQGPNQAVACSSSVLAVLPWLGSWSTGVRNMDELDKTKACPKCKTLKPVEDFSKDKRTPSGLRCWCKSCCSARKKVYSQSAEYRASQRVYGQSEKGKATKRKYRQSAKARLSNKQHRAKCPEKRKAQSAINVAIKYGKITRGPCEVCGTTDNVHAHHDDYSKPYDVRWLCQKHHNEHHQSDKGIPDA